MKKCSKTVFVLAAFVGMALVLGPPAVQAAESGDEQQSVGRRVDVELGVGIFWGLSNEVHLDDSVSYGAAVVIGLSDRLDLELGAQQVDTRVRSDADSFAGETQTVEYLKAALRLYPSTKPDDRVRPYIVAGVTRYAGLDPGDSNYGFLLGPGLRLRMGDNSGIVLSLPIITATSGATKTLMMPNLNFFWSFNFRDGGLGH